MQSIFEVCQWLLVTSVGDMDECSGLSSSAVDSQGDVQRCLHEKSVQNLRE